MNNLYLSTKQHQLHMKWMTLACIFHLLWVEFFESQTKSKYKQSMTSSILSNLVQIKILSLFAIRTLELFEISCGKI